MEKTGKKLRPHYVRKQMHDLGFGYRKLQLNPKNTNSESSLVLRQRWAMEFLDINQK